MSKRLVSIGVVVAVAAASSSAMAHGDAKPTHGGIVQTANDLSFELVMQADGAVIYIVDHEKPVAVAGVTGKLTVLNGADKSEAELKPAGDRLEAKGVRLASGSKVVAFATMADEKTVSLRFAIK